MEAETQESTEMQTINCKPTIFNVGKMNTEQMTVSSMAGAESSKWQCEQYSADIVDIS
jgi:hypothetical protein